MALAKVIINFQVHCHFSVIYICMHNCFYKKKFFVISKDPVTQRYFMVLHYANEGNLRDFLSKKHQSLSWETRINMAKQITSAIKCIHERNIVHRALVSELLS